MTKKRTKQKPDAWMPMYIGDFQADTAHLSLELQMAYINILWFMWRQGARAPNDDRQLASITRLGLKKWRAAKAVLIPFFSVSDAWLFQKRLSHEYEHAWKVYEARVSSGKKGGRPPADDLFDDTERDTERFPERYADSPPQSQSHPQSQAPSDINASGETPEPPDPERARWLRETAKALAKAGCPDCSTQSPALVKALAHGFSREALISLASSKKGAGKGIAYLVSTLLGQRADAQAEAEPSPNCINAAEVARTALVRAQEDKIIEARHLCDMEHISKAERDRRVNAAKAEITAISLNH